MPHVVIEEALDLAVACQSIPLTAARNGSEILKVVDVYLNRSGHTALVDCVAVGHTRSDQAETTLFRFLRGAGTAGLAGIRPVSRWERPGGPLVLVRPMTGEAVLRQDRDIPSREGEWA